MSQKKLNDSIDEYISLKRRKGHQQKAFGKKIGKMFGSKKNKKNSKYPEIEEGKSVMKKKEKSGIFNFLSWNKPKKKKAEKNYQEYQETEEEYLVISTNEKDGYLEEENEISESIEKSPKFTERVKEFFYSKFLNKKIDKNSDRDEDYIEEDDEFEENKKKEIIEEIQELDEQEEDLIDKSKQLKQKKRGLINNFINIFDNGNEYEEKTKQLLVEKYQMERDYEKLESDLKRVAKFTVYILHSLPKRKKDSLKESLEFQEFKNILHKRKLIREEE